ncbi:MAG: nucleotidyltransferase domain-containing protein [Desulfitobacteriaceae bacterium]
MIDKDKWMEEWIEKLQDAFTERLLFVGLQGSYNRGEATQSSDFDVVTVLDVVTVADLRRYRELLFTMSEYKKACGFICGKEELFRWPKYEIFQLAQDTKAYYGTLEDYLPPVTEWHIRDSLQIQSANLYHATAHSYIYGNPTVGAEELKGLYKGAFFALQLAEYLRSGEYVRTKKALCDKVIGTEKELLDISLNWEVYAMQRKVDPDRFFELLLNWCSEAMWNKY